MSKHITPTPVVVVQPRHDKLSAVIEWTTRVILGVALTFLFAWFVQLLLPIVFGVEWGYWRCFWLLFLLRLVIPRPTSFRYQSNLKTSQPTTQEK